MSKHTDKKKKIPEEESDSEELISVEKSKSKRKEKAFQSSEESESNSESETEKRKDIFKIIETRINKYKKEEDGKSFEIPEMIKPQRMEARYNWLWEQIGKTGIPCKPNKKQVEDVRFYILGVTKGLKLHLFYEGRPDKNYSTPTEVLRDIYADYNIDVKSIKGWEQSSAYVSTKKSSPPSWLLFNAIIPIDYRIYNKNSRPKKKNETPKKRKKEDKASEDEKESRKASKHEKIAKYSHTIEETIRIPEHVADDLSNLALRMQLVRGSLALDMETVRFLIKKMNKCLENMENKQSQPQNIIEEEKINVPNAIEEVVEEKKIEEEEEEKKDDSMIESNDGDLI